MRADYFFVKSFWSQLQLGLNNTIVIIGGEIFTIEIRPGSEHRGGIDSGQAECDLNWQLFIVCYVNEKQATNIPNCMDAARVRGIMILLN